MERSGLHVAARGPECLVLSTRRPDLRKGAAMYLAGSIDDATALGRRAALRLVCALLLCALPVAIPVARSADAFSIEAQAQDGAVAIQMQTRLHAHFPVIWATLTDYDGLAQFVPGINYSRVIERRGPTVVIEQRGAAKILFFSYPIDVTVETLENSPDGISVRVLKGNLKRLEGGYRIDRVAGRDNEYLLTWRGLIEPAFAVPSFITVPLLRSTLEHQFLGIVQEIERRDALLAPPAGAAQLVRGSSRGTPQAQCDSNDVYGASFRNTPTDG